MENNQRNSRKRLNSLILLVAFTAVMLIVSTYAWFSTQRNVTLTGLSGVVNVAEGLQISLDAERWVNAINFADFVQPADGSEWTVSSTATAQYLGEGKTFQTPATNVSNTTPSEYKPVSTTGSTASGDGIGKSALAFYQGSVQNFDHLEDIADAPETAKNFFAFDLFVMNTSAAEVKFDKIQLDGISDVKGNVETTGVQNTVRVAFALYQNVNDTAGYKAYNASGYTAGQDMTINSANQLSAAQIIAGTSTGKNIKDIAIWEPNADDHAANIIEQFKGQMTWPASWDNGNSITLASQSLTGDFADGHYLPTYALTGASKTATYKNKTATDPVTWSDDVTGIKDIYNWAATDDDGDDPYVGVDVAKLELQHTTQTAADSSRDPIDLRSKLEAENPAGKEEDGTTTNDGAFDIPANQYSKIRVYVWIEGQDPDCINYASLGGGLTLDLGFSKPSSGS